MRAELIRCGMHLFATNGYETTTVAQVAQAAGMSERSFFRYFASKGELALASQAQIGQMLAARLAERPRSEQPWLALRRTFDPVVAAIDTNAEGRSLRLIEMLHNTPELHRARLEQLDSWARLLAPHVAVHLDDPPSGDFPDPRAAAIAAAAVACYQTAQAAWLSTKGSVSMSTLLDRAMEAVAGIGELKAKRDSSEAAQA